MTSSPEGQRCAGIFDAGKTWVHVVADIVRLRTMTENDRSLTNSATKMLHSVARSGDSRLRRALPAVDPPGLTESTVDVNGRIVHDPPPEFMWGIPLRAASRATGRAITRQHD